MTLEQDPEVFGDKDTKQQILDATVELIRKGGVECVTLRQIAAKAEVNLALVNYYYRSKDNLLIEAVRTLISRFDAAFNALEDEALPPGERLKQFFKQYAGHLLQYPGLAKHMMGQTPSIMGSLHKYSQYSKTMKQKKMLTALREATGEQDEERLRMMMVQLFGAVLMPIVAFTCAEPKDQDESLPGAQLPPVEIQVDHLIDHYFHKYQI
ncbi:AcrR family transcriptional regulator [Paenibacillus forsythiae]|uniref:AcrR family transcriptional regulator n=1 Tax=Paenibacillus forsythiae TaxID=365616 RepID=A0ABU3H7K7_9BACL|nr:TetR/AcrR family transcriptional regulator [Paenibacillus forsythiae]MDT3426711.1 AcrR family transcriptional regulator [Paenibacillus forsythiae]